MKIMKLFEAFRRVLRESTLALAALAAVWAGTTMGANATWTGGSSDASWSTTGNWSTSPVPGTGNTATFNAMAGAGGDVIDLGAGVTITTVLFDTTSAAAYTIGSGAVGSQTLTLNDSGSITMNSTVTANALFNANILLGNTAGAKTYTIINNSATAGQLLTIAGGVSGGGSNTKTLVVTGAGNTEMGGVISTGSATTFALTKSGIGTLTLKGANSYTGLTTVHGGGTLKLMAATGSLSASSGLFLGINDNTYAGGSSFVYDNAGISGATAQTMASLASQASQPNDNTVQITRTVAQPVSLTFTAVTANNMENGNVINFVTKDVAGGGVNGTDYKIVLADQTTYSIIKQNVYFNGGDFAVYDTTAGTGLLGFVRGVNYTSDVGAATSAGGANVIAASGTLNQEITGSVTAQATTILGTSGTTKGTLKIFGASNLEMANNATLTLAIGTGNSGASGLLKTGGGTATISGTGTAQISFGQVQADIRVDTAADVLNINIPITMATNARFMKSGAGTLALNSGTITFGVATGPKLCFNAINGGVLEIGGNAIVSFQASTSASPFSIAQNALLKYSSISSSTFTEPVAGGGSVTVSGGTLIFPSTYASSFTFTGQLTVEGGTLAVGTMNNVSANGVLGNSTKAVILGKDGGGIGTLQFTGTSATYSSTKPFTLATGGTGAFDITNATTTLTLSGAISGAGGLAKSGAGTLEFATTAKTYTGDTTVSDGTLKLSAANTLDDNASLKIVTASGKNPKVELAGGTETVNAFYVNGKQRAKGPWSASGIGADYFTGAGVLTVTTGPLAGSVIRLY